MWLAKAVAGPKTDHALKRIDDLIVVIGAGDKPEPDYIMGLAGKPGPLVSSPDMYALGLTHRLEVLCKSHKNIKGVMPRSVFGALARPLMCQGLSERIKQSQKLLQICTP